MVRAFSTRGPVTKTKRHFGRLYLDNEWRFLMLYIIILCISFDIIYIIQLEKEYQ